jgi:hypothetical protein
MMELGTYLKKILDIQRADTVLCPYHTFFLNIPETLFEAKQQLIDAISEYVTYLKEINQLDTIKPVDIETLKDFSFSENYMFEVSGVG